MTLTGSSNLPVAPRKTPWNAKAAKQRIFEHCKGNVASLSRAFLWRHPNMDGRDLESYSLPFCDVIDGRLHIVPKGIAACAGTRGIGSFAATEEDAAAVRARIVSVYQRVKSRYEDWPSSPFGPLTADASGPSIEGPIALEGVETGDGRFIKKGALRWEDGPWPLVFDRQEMDHTGATVGTVNAIERRDDGVIWGSGNLSDSEDPETALLVLRAAELFNEGAVGVSVSLDEQEDNGDEIDLGDRLDVTAGRIRSVAIVDEAAFLGARLALVAALKPIDPAWFQDPQFGDESDDRLSMQEPDRPEEERQLGAPLQIEGRRLFGHAALWGRCHVGYPGTCTRPPREPAAYRNFLTGERLPGIPTGPLVMKTMHASLNSEVTAMQAQDHYAHTGYAIADVNVGADRYGIWVAGALREDASEADIDCLRGSALSGDWRVIGGQVRLVGLLVVSAPGFRVARALAASGAMITSGPGCSRCGEESSLEERLTAVESRLEELSA